MTVGHRRCRFCFKKSEGPGIITKIFNSKKPISEVIGIGFNFLHNECRDGLLYETDALYCDNQINSAVH